MSSKILVRGGKPLSGEIAISGMKNAALPILFATLLIPEPCTIENIPPVSDIDDTIEILRQMGARVNRLSPTSVTIDTKDTVEGSAPAELVKKLRGSSYLLGAQLGRFHIAHMGWPGGCDFGTRPLDQHKKGFEALGAEEISGNGLCFTAPNGLHSGSTIYFDVASVGATANVMIASVLAEGTTIIDNAAREPHIVDLANFLNSCGASVSGAGTPIIKIRGVERLHGCSYTIIPDMIEAGTYMVAAAATRGHVRISSIIPKHVESITAKISEMGVSVEEGDDYVVVTGSQKFKSINVKTLFYPGFPTDMNPQFAVLQCLASGVSCMQEGVWDNRFRYVEELRKMGATIVLDGRTATIVGGKSLKGAVVDATDLRAGAALVIAGLCADGETEIGQIQYIARGYDDIVGKLRSLGADIEIIEGA